MIDTSAADAYEEYLVPFAFEPWARLVIDQAGLAPGQKVLDVGCGTGVAAKLAAVVVQAKGSVVGVDTDEAMLTVARRSTPAKAAAHIEWRHADAHQLPFAEGKFDAVLCFEALQFLPNRAKALAEFRRVLGPNGRLFGTLWGPLHDNPPYHALAEGLEKFVSADAGRLPPFALGDRTVIHRMLVDSGFLDVSVEPQQITRSVPSAREFVRWVAAGAPTTRHKLSMLADDKREAFLQFVEERLERFRRAGVLELPTMRHIFRTSAN